MTIHCDMCTSTVVSLPSRSTCERSIIGYIVVCTLYVRERTPHISHFLSPLYALLCTAALGPHFRPRHHAMREGLKEEAFSHLTHTIIAIHLAPKPRVLLLLLLLGPPSLCGIKGYAGLWARSVKPSCQNLHVPAIKSLAPLLLRAGHSLLLQSLLWR